MDSVDILIHRQFCSLFVQITLSLTLTLGGYAAVIVNDTECPIITVLMCH